MSSNRLKTMRKVKRKTQQEIARYIGISQNTYSYWESGKVNVDTLSIAKLAEYYGVSIDFLSGRKYKLTNPVEQWHESLREDYYQSDVYTQEYLQYRYGKIVFLGDEVNSMNIQNSVIGDNNKDCCNQSTSEISQLGDIERELISICAKLDMKRKNALLAKAYELLDE